MIGKKHVWEKAATTWNSIQPYLLILKRYFYEAMVSTRCFWNNKINLRIVGYIAPWSPLKASLICKIQIQLSPVLIVQVSKRPKGMRTDLFDTVQKASWGVRNHSPFRGVNWLHTRKNTSQYQCFTHSFICVTKYMYPKPLVPVFKKKGLPISKKTNKYKHVDAHIWGPLKMGPGGCLKSKGTPWNVPKKS